ncbi:MAG: hypothetical protein H0W84_09565 [Bacteroidetes bacterium]|nr:hypothetical protein [Bacteroidota bacterium]
MKGIIIIAAVLFSLFFTECKKYSEDGGISLHKPLRRLINIHWQVIDVSFNGTSINAVFNDSLNLGELEDLQLYFNYSRSSLEVSYVDYAYYGNSDYLVGYGEWKLGDKDVRLAFYKLDGFGSYTSPDVINDHKILNNLFPPVWLIIKLYGSELKIKNNKGYEITFKAVE